jgi:hypothetical protein
MKKLSQELIDDLNQSEETDELAIKAESIRRLRMVHLDKKLKEQTKN